MQPLAAGQPSDEASPEASAAVWPSGHFTEAPASSPDTAAAFTYTSGSLAVRFEQGHELLSLRGSANSSSTLRIIFEGAAGVGPAGSGAFGFLTNIIRGDHPAPGSTGLRSFSKVLYRGLYPGIDLVYSAQRGQLKYQFEARAGADLSLIRLSYEGASGVEVLAGGSLLVNTVAGDLRDAAPLSYDAAGAPVACSFSLRRPGTVGLDCPTWDARHDLIVDPLVYASYVGGNGEEAVSATAEGPSGMLFLTGWTSSNNFPTTPGAFDTTYNASFGGLCFVMAFSAGFAALQWATYFESRNSGGACYGISVNAIGQATIVGESNGGLTTTNGSYDTTFNGVGDAFVARLSSDGSSLLWSTYLGGADYDAGREVFLEANGTVVIVGETNSADFPTTAGAFDRNASSYDLFVARLSGAGDTLLASTVVGGTDVDRLASAACDRQGNVFMAGYTLSTDYPVSASAPDPVASGTTEGFVTKVNVSGASLDFSTYVGGSGEDTPTGIDVAPDGSALVTGWTYSSDFPITANALNATAVGLTDSFALKLSPNGSSFTYSTFLGGDWIDLGGPLASDGAGGAFLVGRTESTDFPFIPGSDDFTRAQDRVYVAHLNANGSAFSYAGFLMRSTGDTSDGPTDVDVDSQGRLLLVGRMQYGTLDTTADAYQTTLGGGSYEAFFAIIDPTPSPVNVTVNSTVAGLLATADGRTLATPFNVSCIFGHAFVVDVPAPQEFGDTRYWFGSWSDQGAANHTAVCDPSNELVWTPHVEYRFNISTDPPGVNVTLDGTEVATPLSIWSGLYELHRIETQEPTPVSPGIRLIRPCNYGGLCNVDYNTLGPTSVVITFQKQYEVTVDSNPPYRLVGVDDSHHGTPFDDWWPANAPRHFFLNALYTAPNGTARYITQGWSDAGPLDRTENITGPFHLTANFAVEYWVQLNTRPAGLNLTFNATNMTDPGWLWWPAGTSLSWDPPGDQIQGDTRYSFAGWDAPNENLTRPFTVNGYTYLAALFRVEYRYRIRTTPISVNLLIDDTEVASPFEVWWIGNTEHNVSVEGGPQDDAIHYRFRDWSDFAPANRTVFAFGGAPNLTATLDVEYRVRIVTDPPGLQVLVDDIVVNSPTSSYWAIGSRHGVGAPSPQGGTDSRLEFANWSDGGEVGHGITMTAPLNLTASFLLEYKITVRVFPSVFPLNIDGQLVNQSFKVEWWVANSSHSVGGVARFPHSATEDYVFQSWSDGGALVHNFTAAAPGELTLTYGPPEVVSPANAGLPLILIVGGVAAVGAVGAAVLLASRRRKAGVAPGSDGAAASGPGGLPPSVPKPITSSPISTGPALTEGPVGCPQCNATVAVGAPYCLQCGLDLVWN